MEQTVLSSGEHSDTEGIVLRYGIFYGPGVPHDELFTRLARWWAMPAITGTGLLSWIEIGDVARATADALDRGRGGQMYNIVDDRPRSFGDYARELAGNCTGRDPGRCRVGWSAWSLRTRPRVRPRLVAAVERQGQGRTRLGSRHSPLKSGARLANIAEMPSVRSLDGMNAEFHAAT